MKEVFFSRNFRKIFFANLFSGFGQGMTFIGISWYLVSSTGSAKLLGSTMFVSAVLMFFMGPYLGTVIDRFSRKKILLLTNFVGFIILAIFAIYGYFGDFTEWMLIAVMLSATFVLQVHYPAQSALVQEGFEERHYQDINSLLEIESQTSSVLAGAVAGVMLEWFGLHTVLLWNAVTYLIAFGLLSTVEYTFTLGAQAEKNAKVSWIELFHQSWIYVKEKPGFLLFGICALLPFIALMAGNLLAPVYVDQTLQGGVKYYSFSEVTYSIGAVAAGFLISYVARLLGNFWTMICNILLFGSALILIVVFPNGWMFVLMYMVIGWCNASVRLIRQTMYMTMVPKHLIGRVLSFFNSIGMMERLILLGWFTVMVDKTGAGLGYSLLGGLLLLASFGAAYSMRRLLSVSPKQENV